MSKRDKKRTKPAGIECEIAEIERREEVDDDPKRPFGDYEGTDDDMFEADDIDAQWLWVVRAEHT